MKSCEKLIEKKGRRFFSYCSTSFIIKVRKYSPLRLKHNDGVGMGVGGIHCQSTETHCVVLQVCLVILRVYDL
jgi:hypothetical protein